MDIPIGKLSKDAAAKEYAVEAWLEKEFPAEEWKERFESAKVLSQKYDPVVMIARLLPVGEKGRKTATDSLLRRLPAGRKFWAHLLANTVRELVDEGRKDVFGSPEQPFSTYEAAFTWLEGQRMGWTPTDERRYRANWDRIDLLIGRALKNVGTAPGIRTSANLERVSLPYVRVGGGTRRRLVAKTPQLKALTVWVDRIVAATSWTKESTIAYILAGVLPISAGPRIVFHGIPTQGLPWTWIEMRLHPEDLSEAGIRRAFIQAKLWKPKKRQTSTQDLRLLDLMEEIGLPPKGEGKGRPVGRSAYWNRCASFWRLRFREDCNPETLRKRWERMCERNPDLITLMGGGS